MPTPDEQVEPIILPNPEEIEKAKEEKEKAAKKGEVKSVKAIIDSKEKPKEEETPINFLDNNYIEQKVEAPTKKDSENKEKSSSSGSTTGGAPEAQNIREFREKLIQDEKESASEFTMADFQENSDMIIDFICFLLSALFRWWSLDTTDTPYEFPKHKIDSLKTQLTKVPVRYNKAFPIIGLFIGTLLVMCITPARKAYDHRKLVKQERAKKKKEEAGNDNTGNSKNPLKRGKGQPSK